MVFLERGNVSIRVAASVLGERAGRVLDLPASALVLGVLVLMAWQFLIYTPASWAQGNETTWVLQIPVAPSGTPTLSSGAPLVQALVTARDASGLARPSTGADARPA